MKTNYKKHILDGLLIVFSVLFALFINKVAQNYDTNKKKNFAIASIKKEIQQNVVILERWSQKHNEIMERIDSIISGENDSLKNEFLKNKHFDIGIISNNKSIISQMLSDAAWETSKTTGIISELDFNMVQALSDSYKLQQFIFEKTLTGIFDYILSTNGNDMTQLDNILQQYKLRFNELVGQEQLLKVYYERALGRME